jgi:hypothetical protein
MTADGLTAALRARAAGIYPLEPGVALLIANGTFLHRPDFTSRFITTGTSISDGTTPMADIDWDAATAPATVSSWPAWPTAPRERGTVTDRVVVRDPAGTVVEDLPYQQQP